MKRALALSALTAGVLLLAGCGTQTQPNNNQPAQSQDQAGNNQPAASQNQGNQVNIQGFAFSPAELTVKVGTTVKWVNMDPANHQIKSSLFGSKVLSTGQSHEFTFKTVGTYNYSCSIHPTMTGTIIVEP